MTRTEIVKVRLTQAEKTILARLRGDGGNTSAAIRLLIRDRAGLSLPVAAVDAAALSEIADQLRRVGVNLNQAVRAMNEGRIAYEPRLADALTLLSETLFELRRDVDGWMKLGVTRKAPHNVI